MTMRAKANPVLFVVTLCVLATAALGQGYIIVPPPGPWPPPPPPRPRPFPVPPRDYLLRVKSEKVNVTIKDNVAETAVEQVFHNDLPQRVEGTYMFPLPEEAAISEFAMYVNGKRMEGEVLDRDKARGIYEDIVRQARDPALLEYVGRNAFRARIFPIEPNSDQKIELKYSEPLKGESGTFRYTLPLKVDNCQSQPYEELAVTVKLASKVSLKGLYSPTHEVDVQRDGDRKATVSFEANKAVPDKDFVLYYNLSEKDFGLSLVTHREAGEDGFFMMLLAPKQELQQQEIAGKEIVFVCDTSGSMSGDDKIDQAKSALRFCLKNLNSDDRFALVTFSTEVRTFREQLVAANKQNVQAALEFVDKIKARGGTDIDSALQAALKMMEGKEQTAMVAFLTDGLPTVGETDLGKILENAEKVNKGKRARVFAFGVGFDVNTHLLDTLSGDNGGASQYVKPKEDLEVKLSAFYEKIACPVMADLEVDFGKVRTHDVYPKRLPDLFKGSQLTVFGRYDGTADTAVTLTGTVGGKQQKFAYDAGFPKSERNDCLPRLWATRKVGYLLDAIRLKGDDRELRDEIVKLALEHGIVTPYTSFLVQEDTDRIALRPQFRQPREFQPMLEAPASTTAPTRFGSGFGGGGLGAADMAAAKEGEAAVQVAQSVERLKRSNVADELVSRSREMRRVGAKLFYLTDGVWIDGQYATDKQTLKVKYLSDAYFALASANAELAKCFALGDRMVVCWKDRCVEVGPDGKETLSPEELKAFAANAKQAAAPAAHTPLARATETKPKRVRVALAAVPAGLLGLGGLLWKVLRVA
jgi:Ca-activated chloride channel family protein